MTELLLTIWIAGVAGCIVSELRDVWIWHEPVSAIVHAVLWPVVLVAISIVLVRDFIRLRAKP